MNATIRAKYDDPGYRDFCREITQRKWDRRKRRRDALAMTEGAKGVRLENESGGQLLIHPATRPDRESDWQLTTIGPDGKPWGHNNPPTFQDAVARAVGASKDSYYNEHGYKIIEVIR